MSEAANGNEKLPPYLPGGHASRMTPGEWLLLLTLATVQFTHIVDFMIIMPLGPVYLREMGLTPGQFGLVVAAYTVSAGVANLLAARFLDRFDRKSSLLVLYTGFIAGTLLCAAAPNYLLLLAARTVAGAFGGVAAAVVLAIIGDVFHDARRGTATGVVMSAFSVASIAGVPLGLHLADVYGWHAPFVVLGGIGGVVLVIAAVLLPPLRGHLVDRHEHTATTWDVVADPNHLRAFTLTVALVLSTFLLAPFLATFLVANVGLRQDELKLMYLCGGAATLVTLTVFGRLADRFGKLPVFRILALATLVSIVVVSNLPAGLAVTAVLASTTFFMVTSSGRMVPAMALITAASAPAYRGSFMSLNTAVQHLASGLAASVGGALLHTGQGQAGLPALAAGTAALAGAPTGQGPLLAASAVYPGRNEVFTGYPLVGLLACTATLASLYLAGRLRHAPGDVAPDSAAVAAFFPEPGAPDRLAVGPEQTLPE